MIKKIMEGISIKLNQVFGDGVQIYLDGATKEELKEPYFSILLLSLAQKDMIGTRKFRSNSFDIHYFPEIKGSNLELQGMASNLYEALETITLTNGDLIRGTKMNHDVVDGVLHFFINFDMYVKKVTVPEDKMGIVNHETSVKG